MTLRRSPLYDAHQSAGAKLIDFGGWEMPLSYPSGTVAEHMACRSDAVVFDVSHLGTVRCNIAGSFDELQRTLTNDLNKVSPGRAQYTHLLNSSGGVVDDIIVWWVDDQWFEVMPNAANTAPVLEVLTGVDVTAERAVLAIQGPAARSKLATVFPEAAQVPRFEVQRLKWRGVDTMVAGTGYTGEDGVEVAIESGDAPALWDALVAAEVTPAGLGARDTLRLEAGLPLHGNELGPEISPLQAGLGWVVAWDKGDFIGKAALEAQRQGGLTQRLRGLVTAGRQPPRHDNDVQAEGRVVGKVTSGNFSPVLGTGIAMALLPVDMSAGDAVSIESRGRLLDAHVTRMPFVRSGDGGK